MMRKGIVFDISRFRTEDGPGIRTAVFLKGCPLRCLWCHNPESNDCRPELAYDRRKCTGCGGCESVCPRNCHTITREGVHLIRREQCIACGACARVCRFEALRVYGREMSVESVMGMVRRDKAFYKSSGGGLTISGGEPLLQASFTEALLEAAHLEGIRTCMETSGYASASVFRETAKRLDCILFDCKAVEPELHRRLTGVSNEMILSNLRLADEMGIPIILRVPVIPGCNDSKAGLQAVGKLAEGLRHIMYIEVMPYHPLGLAKAEQLGKKMGYENQEFPGEEAKERWIRSIREQTRYMVR